MAAYLRVMTVNVTYGLTVHRDQLRAYRWVTSMEELYLFILGLLGRPLSAVYMNIRRLKADYH